MSNLLLIASGISLTGFSFSLLAKYFFYKKINLYNKKETTAKNDNMNNTGVLNLTPHNINLYDSEKKLLVSLKPEDPKFQLRLTNDEKPVSDFIRIFSNNYDNKITHPDVGENYDDWLNGNYVSVKIPIKKPIEYTKIDGINELKNLTSNNYYGYSIIVSSMVAEFLIKNKSNYKYLCNHVLVPDTNPQNVIRDDKGIILGVTGFIDYGTLE
jgi:hypothetical protein